MDQRSSLFLQRINVVKILMNQPFGKSNIRNGINLTTLVILISEDNDFLLGHTQLS
jgi:hypothetical protein